MGARHATPADRDRVFAIYMLYVHVAESHAREWPDPVKAVATHEVDPDKRIVAMLGLACVAATWQHVPRRRTKVQQ